MLSQFDSLLLSSPMHNIECLGLVDEIIDNMDEKGILELMQGSSGDLDWVLKNLLEDTYKTIYTGNPTIDFTPKYTQRVAESAEEVLRVNNLNYFITSVLPDFQLSWHHLEWGDLTMNHKKLCIEAARDHGKCLAEDTPIRMFDGSIKLACEVIIGDVIMGINSQPRVVSNINFGEDELYRIKQSKGDDYVVNSRHIMTLIHSNRVTDKKEIVDIDLPDLLKFSKNWISERYRGFKVDYELPERKVLIDPYFLGMCLGDGNSHNPGITNIDIEVTDYLKKYAESLGMTISNKGCLWNIRRCIISCKTKNKLFTRLKAYKLIQNKHIPSVYLQNSKKVRMEILAGLLDSDGNLWCGAYHFDNINKRLCEDVKNLADSLGFKATLRGGSSFNNQLGRDYEAYSVSIFGKIDEIPVKIKRKKIIYDWSKKQSNKDWGIIDNITPTTVSSLKIKSIGRGKFVSITTDGDKRFLLGDGTVVHNSYYFSNAYAAWQLYRYARPQTKSFSLRPSASNSNRGYLFSFSLQQAVDLIEILKGTIETTPILNERLFPTNRTSGAWASTNIVCKNGARLTGKGFGSSVRGAHPYWIVVDDGLKDNVIYSALQRQKSTDYFHAVIMNMLVPGGQIIVVGTPFHALDLYGDLKTKSGWFVVEYPSIFPDGKVLWPQRWGFKDLLEKKSTQGNIIFSRENLCRPIINEASIFPMSILVRSLVRMENYVLVRNRDDFPIKFNKVVVGSDFSISANVAADYSVNTVWGVDDETGERWLLHFDRTKGRTFFEQMQALKAINVRFRPDCMVMEQNVFQQIFVQESDRAGMPVVGHTTGIDKYDLKTGWCGLAIDFERGKIHIPIGDKFSEDVKDLIFSDLGSVAFTDKGLQSVGEHDDISSSFWLAKLGANLMTTGFKYTFL